MADSKFFGVPFASTGDREIIPNLTDPSGAVSYAQGFGPDYERDPATDPLAKRVPRAETNEYLYQITNALKFLQTFGIPEWFPDDGTGAPVSYPLGARVRYNAGGGMRMWRSLIAANTSTPGANYAQWTPYEEGAFLGVKRFSASGTYTPTPGTRRIIVDVVGGGGGAASVPFAAAGQYSGSAGAGAGGRAVSEMAVPSSPVAVTVGVGGAGGAAGSVGVDGVDGGESRFGTTLRATGGGRTSPIVTLPVTVQVQQPGGEGGEGIGGNILNAKGGAGGSFLLLREANCLGGVGGSSALSGGPRGARGAGGGPGEDAILGAGGSGAVSVPGSGSQRGGRGGTGLVLVYEYA